MAEYWKSAPRHWCKQCKIFIRDTPFEKTQHEASPKHQGSLKRFLRDIHKNNEMQQRDTARAKSEVERLRQAVSGEPSASQSHSEGKPPAPAKRAPAPSDRPVSVEERKKQMAQLVEMGVAIPQEYRGDMALTGEWETVSEQQLDIPEGARSIGIRKRKLEGDEDEEGGQIPEQYVNKWWGSRMKIYPGADDDGEEEDLDALFASTKDLKKPKVDTEATSLKEQESPFTLAPKKEEGNDADDQIAGSKAPPAATEPDVNGSSPVKKEEIELSAIPLASTTPESESVSKNEAVTESEEAPGVVFKKRKAKVMRK
ncbi:Zinc finger U1-type [Penicillium verhagenii]|nr:Zinc finger U1-type [Penicillium verhagenii]